MRLWPGLQGWRELIRDAQGRIIDVQPAAEESPSTWASRHIDIGAVIQLFTEQALDEVVEQFRPQACCCRRAGCRAGQVLAMASRRSFDRDLPEEAAAERGRTA